LSAFAQRTGLPEFLLRDNLPLDLGRVRDHFEEQIVGQPAAIQTAVRVVASIKAGLTDPSRPSAVLLFCGPTGVGKTALAQALAAYCFGAAGQKDRLVRLDLSEFSGPLAAHRLVQGMAGEPAAWLQKVRAQPFCVVLFDEIEKAAPEVFDVLLGVLDEGRLTDTFGRVTHFRSAIVILTSNLGSSQSARMGFGLDSGPDYDAEVQKFFRPEFFNRLDSVVAFNALTPEDVRKIVRKELGEIRMREGVASLGLELAWESGLEEAIARAGYDHRLGTRPLQRALERMVVVPLARWLLEIQPARGSRIHLSLDDEGRLRVSVGAGG
jgi:ATP-dependent Clp protease ATP-binding subunit ClpA